MIVPAALTAVLEALTPRLPARVQRVLLADDGRVVVELFVGERLPVLLDPRPPAPGLRLTQPALPRGEKPPREQGALRKELVPSRLVSVDVSAAQGLLRLGFERPDGGARSLILELSVGEPRLVLTGRFEDAERVLVVLGAPRPQDGRDLRRGRAYEPPRAPGPLPTAGPDDDDADAHERTLAGASRERELRQSLKAEHRRVSRLIRALESDLAKHGDPEVLSLEGELLKTALGRLRRGAPHVDVVDWEGEVRRVMLSPALSPKENLERLFRRSRKAREGRLRVLPRLEEARSRLASLEETRAALASGAPGDELLARAAAVLRDDERAAASPRRRAAREGPRRPYRAFRISDDVIARVGRSARDNDELTFHIASGNDIWLHARGVTGSHVIVPSDKRGEIAPEVLLDAAHLAAWFSPLRKSERADVQYSQRKHLRRPGKGAPAGLVLVPKERVLHVRVQPERIAQLLANEIAAS